MYNRAILIGRLTADPELRTTPQGTSVCSFSIAIDRPFTGKGAERVTDFINIVAWRQNAEFVSKYFAKGRLIGIEGSIQARNYEDKQGIKRTAVEVVADRAFFTESKGSSSGGAQSAQGAQSHPEPAGGVSYSSGSFGDFQEQETGEDDLPF